jgi:hypothetical protein
VAAVDVFQKRLARHWFGIGLCRSLQQLLAFFAVGQTHCVPASGEASSIALFQFVVLLIGEVAVIAATRPRPHRVLEVLHVLKIAARDEGAELLLGGESDVAGALADYCPAVGRDEVDDPTLIQLKIHQDAAHGVV